jgi:hypothetical protein
VARIYAILIEKELKNLDQVPLRIRDEVEQILKQDGYIIRRN